MSTVLLIGATGFIGRHVAARSSMAGTKVITASRSVGEADVCLDLAAGPEALAALIRDTAPDAVVNCAGRTHGDATAMVRDNVVAVANLATAMARSAPHTRLVHLGSAAEYGAVPEGSPVAESCAARPLAAYGVTKLAGTELIRASDLDAVVLRVFNPVGPGASPFMLAGRLATELRRTAGTGEDVYVGSLAAYRDFVDVRDVADAVTAAAYARVPLPTVLNVGSGQATSLRELATTLAAIAGSDRQVLEKETAGSDRSPGVAWQQADIGTIVDALGWAPATDLTTSLRDLWEDDRCLI